MNNDDRSMDNKQTTQPNHESQTDMLDFSIVVPVYNEEESLQDLMIEISAVMQKMNRSYEVVFVDDCSDDKTPELLNDLKENYRGIIRIIPLEDRTGQTKAMRIGLDQVRGDYVVTMDADLQNDPHDIPKMFEKLNEGYDCVCGWRKAREDTPLKAGLSKFGNVLQRLLTGLKIHDVSCTLRLYRKRHVDHITLNWEGQHRFIPLSLSLQGLSVAEIESNHRKRKYGYTKYSHKRIFKVVVDFFKVLIARGR